MSRCATPDGKIKSTQAANTNVNPVKTAGMPGERTYVNPLHRTRSTSFALVFPNSIESPLYTSVSTPSRSN